MFAAVVEHRSFTDAARALSVSKATVSKAVTRLEEHLDTSLFNRTSRRLALTESGKRLADHAHRILAEGQAAEEAARIARIGYREGKFGQLELLDAERTLAETRLAAIDALTRQYEAKKDEAARKCALALDAKRRSVSKGAAALDQTASLCQDMDSTFESLTENAMKARTELEQFPRAELEDARLAARNLAALLTQLDVYAQIPERCASLRQDLRQNFPQSLVSTYKKAMELELWRAALQRRVSIETDLARQREASGDHGNKSDYGLEELAALSRTLSTRVAAVAELVHDVFDAAREPLDGDNALELLARHERARGVPGLVDKDKLRVGAARDLQISKIDVPAVRARQPHLRDGGTGVQGGFLARLVGGGENDRVRLFVQ